MRSKQKSFRSNCNGSHCHDSSHKPYFLYRKKVTTRKNSVIDWSSWAICGYFPRCSRRKGLSIKFLLKTEDRSQISILSCRDIDELNMWWSRRQFHYPCKNSKSTKTFQELSTETNYRPRIALLVDRVIVNISMELILLLQILTLHLYLQ